MYKDMCYKYCDYIIRKYNSLNENKYPLSNKRLQKILFVASVIFSRNNNGEKMFSDNFEAWDYGPVIPEVYDSYSIFQFGKMYPLFIPKQIGNSEQNALDEAFEVTADIPTEILIENAHEKDSPWYQTYLSNESNPLVKKYHVIDHRLISKYYSNEDNYRKLIRKIKQN